MRIPVPVIAVVADALAMRYTHNRLDYLMEQGGIAGEPPQGNKVDKTRAWLKRANAENINDSLSLLGKVLEEFMEVDSAGYGVSTDLSNNRERVNKKLIEHGLMYLKGGYVVRAGISGLSRSLEETIRNKTWLGCRENSNASSRILRTIHQQQ